MKITTNGIETVATYRRITRECEVSGQGLVQGQKYPIIKASVIEVPGLGVKSSAWVWDDDVIREIKNAHIAFKLEA